MDGRRERAPLLKPRTETTPQLEQLATDFLKANEPLDDPRIRFKAGGSVDDGLVLAADLCTSHQSERYKLT
jgi:hypothetical protein